MSSKRKRSIIGYGTPHFTSREKIKRETPFLRDKAMEIDKLVESISIEERKYHKVIWDITEGEARIVQRKEKDMEGNRDLVKEDFAQRTSTDTLSNNLVKWEHRLPWETILGRLALIEKMKKKHGGENIETHWNEDGTFSCEMRKTKRNRNK